MSAFLIANIAPMMFGVLVLGSKETLRFMAPEECYQQIAPPEKIFRKVKPEGHADEVYAALGSL